MSKLPKAVRQNWFAKGQRVVRKDTEEAGTIIEADRNHIKVKWDGGRTSYFTRGQTGNFRSTGSNSN